MLQDYKTHIKFSLAFSSNKAFNAKAALPRRIKQKFAIERLIAQRLNKGLVKIGLGKSNIDLVLRHFVAFVPFQKRLHPTALSRVKGYAAKFPMPQNKSNTQSCWLNSPNNDQTTMIYDNQ